MGRQSTTSAEQIDCKLGATTQQQLRAACKVYTWLPTTQAPHCDVPVVSADHSASRACTMAAAWLPWCIHSRLRTAMVHACTAEHAYKQPCGNCPRLRIMDLYNYQ